MSGLLGVGGGGGGGGGGEFPNYPQQGGGGNPRTGGGGRNRRAGPIRRGGGGKGRRKPRGPQRSLVVVVDLPVECRGRVIGTRGKTIKRIEQASDARLQIQRQRYGDPDPEGSLRIAAEDAVSVFRASVGVAEAAGAGPFAARCEIDGVEVRATLDRVGLTRHVLFSSSPDAPAEAAFACYVLPNPGDVIQADSVATALDNQIFSVGDEAFVFAIKDPRRVAAERIYCYGWGAAGVRGAGEVASELLALPPLAEAIATAIAAEAGGDRADELRPGAAREGRHPN